MNKKTVFLIITALTIFWFFILGSTIAVSVLAYRNKPTWETCSVAPVVKEDPFKKEKSEELFRLINEYRVSNGLRPLTKSKLVCDLATVRAIEMPNDFSHVGFRERFTAYEYWRAIDTGDAGENLARNFETPQEILDAWIKSPLHKEQLDAVTENGCVVCYKEYCVMNTMTIY